MEQYTAENEPSYRHASIDIFLDPSVHGRGLGRDAVRVLAKHLIWDLGHHRIVIDPAADNAAAIRCYAAVGFQPVGVMRRYERDADGAGWHDGLLMDLLAEELALQTGEASYQAPGFLGGLFLGEVASAWHYPAVDVVEADGSESTD